MLTRFGGGKIVHLYGLCTSREKVLLSRLSQDGAGSELSVKINRVKLDLNIS